MAISILVVDDSPMARKMLIKALPAHWNLKVTQAGNGKEAIAEFRAGKVDLMFLDLTMPEMDGYQTLEAMRNEGLKCVVIVVSADIQPIAQERVLKAGAAAFIKKPVDIQKLEPILRQFGLLE